MYAVVLQVFTSEAPLDSVVESSNLGQSVQDKFAGALHFVSVSFA